MLISLSRAEKLIGSYNLSLVSFLIERMSKGKGEKKKKEKHFHSTHFHFLISFFKKSFITTIDIFIISVGYLICHALSVSRKKKTPLKTANSLMNLQSILQVFKVWGLNLSWKKLTCDPVSENAF